MKTRLTGLSAILLLSVGAAIAADPFAPAASCKPDETTGKCAPGVCEQCCNAFIPDDKCASCLQEECPPPAPHNCMPDSGTNKCEDPGVCQDCCSKYIPDDQCDACVDASCPKPSPSWLPGKRWCFAADPRRQARGVPPCSQCGLVFNTVESTPGGPAVAHGTLNYTGYAWGTKKFQCFNMAYQYDNRTGTLSFPNVATTGSVANQCLTAFVSPLNCPGGPGPKLTNVADWSFNGLGERAFTCIRNYLEFPDDPTKGCVTATVNPVMQFSNRILQCISGQPDYNWDWHFFTETNGAPSECRFV